jgi:ribosomal protein S18 acetylase RimI-like enzyme
MTFRQGNSSDVEQLRLLGLATWKQYQSDLTPDNRQKLFSNLNRKETYVELLEQSHSIVCEDDSGAIIGMAFLVPSGNPTDIYQSDWSYIRFVSVHPEFSGKGIGRQLTEKCIEIAKSSNEHIVALHTSEMMHRARHIYESLGFTIFRELEPRLGKKYWLYTLAIA